MSVLTRATVMIILLLIAGSTVHSQSPGDSINPVVSPSYLESVSSKASKLQNKLDKKSSAALLRLQKQEAKIRRKLAKTDSTAATKVFGDANARYKELQERLNGTLKGPYIGKLDSFTTSINFLQNNPEFLSSAKEVKEKIDDALSKVKGLKDQFNKAEALRQFLKERREYLKNQLSKLGFAKELKNISKISYYYGQQVQEYKNILKDSRKAEKKALELLAKSKFFKDFMRRNGELASLFHLPGDPGNASSQASLAGLQTRASVNSFIQQQIAVGGPGAAQQVSQNIQTAQTQLTQLKDKVLKAGGNSIGDDLPDFKPSSQKTKSFLKRLEFGTNIQTQKATNYFPITSDIGLSVGYKLNDNSMIGLGASYKMGLGTGWRDITITHQGVGLRSYLDIRLKKSLWITGGYEQNYRSAFNDIAQLQDKSAWQRSGLLGLSKVISLRTKFFKKTKIQLLWDVLSYEQIPRTQPIIFRLGYSFRE